MSKLRSTCSAWELRTGTPEGPLAPGAAAGKCFPQHQFWLLHLLYSWLLTRSILLHLQSDQGGSRLPTSLNWTEEMTLSLIVIATVLGLYSIYFYLLVFRKAARSIYICKRNWNQFIYASDSFFLGYGDENWWFILTFKIKQLQIILVQKDLLSYVQPCCRMLWEKQKALKNISLIIISSFFTNKKQFLPWIEAKGFRPWCQFL